MLDVLEKYNENKNILRISFWGMLSSFDSIIMNHIAMIKKISLMLKLVPAEAYVREKKLFIALKTLTKLYYYNLPLKKLGKVFQMFVFKLENLKNFQIKIKIMYWFSTITLALYLIELYRGKWIYSRVTALEKI